MRLAKILRGVGETLITLGVVVLLFVAYELWFTGIETARAQHRLAPQLEQEWHRGGLDFSRPSDRLADPPLGDALARIRIPRFGRNWSKIIVEGVGVADLKKGPGHYPHTALPGQLGNFVVSGHRTTYGAPFNRIEEIRTGDAIVIEDAAHWYTYRVDGFEIVRPTASTVLGDDPSYPHTSQRLITLTTCHPKYSASRRYVVYGHLQDTAAKSAGLPAALTGRP